MGKQKKYLIILTLSSWGHWDRWNHCFIERFTSQLTQLTSLLLKSLLFTKSQSLNLGIQKNNQEKHGDPHVFVSKEPPQKKLTWQWNITIF